MDQHHDNHFVPQVSDELEQLILQEIVRRVRANSVPRVLDVPCGNGRHAVAMAKLGAQVVAADAVPREGAVKGRALAAALTEKVDFSACQLGGTQLPSGPYDLIFCHHGLHLLPYAEARQWVRQLVKSLRIGGKLFISAYGLHSALGEAYEHFEQPVGDRYCRLSAPLARCYNIDAPVCLYTERNLVTLLFEAGASVLKSFTTTHGTVKAVAVKV